MPRYRLIVEGELRNGVRRGLGELYVEPEGGETVIEGVFADTAELTGLLDRLRELGFGLIAASLVDRAPRLGSVLLRRDQLRAVAAQGRGERRRPRVLVDEQRGGRP